MDLGERVIPTGSKIWKKLFVLSICGDVLCQGFGRRACQPVIINEKRVACLCNETTAETHNEHPEDEEVRNENVY